MTSSSEPEFTNPKYSANPHDLASDPEYANLLDLYQNAEFDRCHEILVQLEQRYPDHPDLIKFKDNMKMRSSIRTISDINQKEEKRQKKIATLKLGVFAIVGTMIATLAFIFSYNYLSTTIAAEQKGDETAQFTYMSDQVEQLLLVGKPQPAAEILETIRAINPDYELLPELTTRTEKLLRLEAQYQTALNFISENKPDEALAILNEINSEMPGLWDVSQQIDAIKEASQIEHFLEEGNAAYQAENWTQVVSAYENALLLDPQLDEPLMKEQLLNGYLNSIISMLQNESSTIEDIQTAEQYYRKAVALIPQSREFSSERKNLQELSSNLLELKFTQLAKENLADKNQNFASISKTVSYLRKAANINPKNAALQLDLKNAEYYQIAFQNFVEMNWIPAINNFNQIISVDPNFAGGNVNLLLFEAYYALGKQYLSAGFYQDAIINLEQAEILVWDDHDNLMKLFQTQVLLGDTFGKMDDYENAVSYYQYALNAIRVLPRLTNHPAIATKFFEAENLSANENYENAFASFQAVLKDIDVIYSISEVEISDGVCLALFANSHLSTIDAIFEANNLPKSMIISMDQTINVPTIKK